MSEKLERGSLGVGPTGIKKSVQGADNSNSNTVVEGRKVKFQHLDNTTIPFFLHQISGKRNKIRPLELLRKVWPGGGSFLPKNWTNGEEDLVL